MNEPWTRTSSSARFRSGALELGAGGATLQRVVQTLRGASVDKEASKALVSGTLTADFEQAGFGPLLTDPKGRLALPAGFQYRELSPLGGALANGDPVPGWHDGMAAFRIGERVIERAWAEAAVGRAVATRVVGERHPGGRHHRPISSSSSSGLNPKTAGKAAAHTLSTLMEARLSRVMSFPGASSSTRACNFDIAGPSPMIGRT